MAAGHVSENALYGDWMLQGGFQNWACLFPIVWLACLNLCTNLPDKTLGAG